MIHFVPPHNEKVRARVPELAATVDVVLGNLEDAVPIDQKEAARKGFVAMARATDFAASGTGLWTRINALNSPWILDDLFTLVAECGDKLDVVMVPKVEGPWDIHYIDQLLAQLEARHRLPGTLERVRGLLGQLVRPTVHRGVLCLVVGALGIEHGERLLRRRAGVEVDQRLAVADAAREHGKILSHARRVERNVSHDQALTSLPTAALTYRS